MPDDLPFGKDRSPDYPDTEDRGKLSDKQRAELVLKQEGRCALCGCKPRKFEADHIQELWEGGTNAPDNWQALCSDCHKHKSSAAAKRRAKMNRLRLKTGQIKRRKERDRPLIANPGFAKRSGPSVLSKAHKNYQKRGFQKRAVKT